jgi:beta-glucanase (GH16 family)
VFHLVSRRSQGYEQTTATTDDRYSFTQGYVECRMRWTTGPGSWPACWLLSQGWANTGSCTTPAAEIDVMEGQGTEPNVLYGTIHRHSAGSSCGGNQINGNNWQPQPFALAGQWHTYATLWTATQVCWYVDNVQSHCAPTFSTTNQPMFLLLQMWIGGWTSGTNSSTADELHTEVDWVRVWQK